MVASVRTPPHLQQCCKKCYAEPAKRKSFWLIGGHIFCDQCCPAGVADGLIWWWQESKRNPDAWLSEMTQGAITEQEAGEIVNCSSSDILGDSMKNLLEVAYRKPAKRTAARRTPEYLNLNIVRKVFCELRIRFGVQSNGSQVDRSSMGSAWIPACLPRNHDLAWSSLEMDSLGWTRCTAETALLCCIKGTPPNETPQEFAEAAMPTALASFLVAAWHVLAAWKAFRDGAAPA